MKKISIILIAVLAMCSFTACKNSSSNSSTTSTPFSSISSSTNDDTTSAQDESPNKDTESSDNTQQNVSVEGNFQFEEIDGGLELSDGNGDFTDLNIPTESDGKTIISIGNRAFKNHEK